MNMAMRYNTNLLRGTGLVQETIRLLNVYQQGETMTDFASRVIADDVLAKPSEHRVRIILSIAFFPRYVAPGTSVTSALQRLLHQHVGVEALTQLFLVYTSRANPILGDFLRTSYWRLVNQEVRTLPPKAVKEFIAEANSNGSIIRLWSPKTVDGMSEHLTACLIDFRLIEKNRNIIPYYPFDAPILFVLHELHLQGIGDTALLTQPEWQWLGLSTASLLRHLERLAAQGHFIMQYSGELLRISWRYTSLAQVTDALTRI